MLTRVYRTTSLFLRPPMSTCSVILEPALPNTHPSLSPHPPTPPQYIHIYLCNTSCIRCITDICIPSPNSSVLYPISPCIPPPNSSSLYCTPYHHVSLLPTPLLYTVPHITMYPSSQLLYCTLYHHVSLLPTPLLCTVLLCTSLHVTLFLLSIVSLELYSIHYIPVGQVLNYIVLCVSERYSLCLELYFRTFWDPDFDIARIAVALQTAYSKLCPYPHSTVMSQCA